MGVGCRFLKTDLSTCKHTMHSVRESGVSMGFACTLQTHDAAKVSHRHTLFSSLHLQLFSKHYRYKYHLSFTLYLASAQVWHESGFGIFILMPFLHLLGDRDLPGRQDPVWQHF